MEIAEGIFAFVGAMAIGIGLIWCIALVLSQYEDLVNQWRNLWGYAHRHESRISQLECELRSITAQVQCNSENIHAIKTAKKK